MDGTERMEKGIYVIALCRSLAPFPHISEKGRDHHSFYQFPLKDLKKENPVKWLCMCTTRGKPGESRNWHGGGCPEGKVSQRFHLVNQGILRFLKLLHFCILQHSGQR